jgi:hypothetical protein
MTTGNESGRETDSPTMIHRLLSGRWNRILVACLFAYFAVRLVIFAVVIDSTVPPDEMDHFGRSVVFSQSLLIPEDSPDTYKYGVIGRSPYLFYLLMGKLLHLNVFGLEELVFLRFWNVALALLNVFFGYRWIRLVSDRQAVQLLFLVIITNILMFTGIGASVSYDNLTNLLATISIYYLTLFLDKRSPTSLAAFFAAVLAGGLTKVSFLPIAAILVVMLLVRERLEIAGFMQAVRRSFRPFDWRRLVVYGLVVLLLVLNVGLYGVNFAVFGRLTPKPEQVLDLEEAMKNRIFARNYIVAQFRQGELSYEEAVEMAEKIENPGNRRRALNLLKVARDPVRLRNSLIAPEYYVYLWSLFMLADGLGYHGHRVIRKIGRDLWPALAILALAIIVFIRKWTPGEANGHLTVAAIVSVAYAMVLIKVVNYPVYKESGVLDYVLQGRYFFPALVPFCGLIAYYLMTYLTGRKQLFLGLVTAAYFIYGDFFFFLEHTSTCWFMGAGLRPECLLTL